MPDRAARAPGRVPELCSPHLQKFLALSLAPEPRAVVWRRAAEGTVTCDEFRDALRDAGCLADMLRLAALDALHVLLSQPTCGKRSI